MLVLKEQLRAFILPNPRPPWPFSLWPIRSHHLSPMCCLHCRSQCMCPTTDCQSTSSNGFTFRTYYYTPPRSNLDSHLSSLLVRLQWKPLLIWFQWTHIFWWPLLSSSLPPVFYPFSACVATMLAWHLFLSELQFPPIIKSIWFPPEMQCHHHWFYLFNKA